MLYSIVHTTNFKYSAPISETVMELRMNSRSDEFQRCLQFSLAVEPKTKVFDYLDYQNNLVHHFDIPSSHRELKITTKSIVEMLPERQLPVALAPESWGELDALVERQNFWEFLMPSHFAKPGESLNELARELNISRRADPLTILREINTALYQNFTYAPDSTEVDSPIDDAIAGRGGVCQDFSNIMIALARSLKIPCRYVSGYLFHRTDDRSHAAQDATHAWTEAYLPALGWVGFDPTNNTLAGERHIRVAVGRDYADVPPTRGVFKGLVESELHVAVSVTTARADEIESLRKQNAAPPPLFNSIVKTQQEQQQQ